MLENPTSVRLLSKPMNMFSQVALLITGLRPRTAATRRPRSGSAPVRVRWSVPTYASGGKPEGRAPTPILSSPLSRMVLGTLFRMASTRGTVIVLAVYGAPVAAATATPVVAPSLAATDADVLSAAPEPQAVRAVTTAATAPRASA